MLCFGCFSNWLSRGYASYASWFKKFACQCVSVCMLYVIVERSFLVVLFFPCCSKWISHRYASLDSWFKKFAFQFSACVCICVLTVYIERSLLLVMLFLEITFTWYGSLDFWFKKFACQFYVCVCCMRILGVLFWMLCFVRKTTKTQHLDEHSTYIHNTYTHNWYAHSLNKEATLAYHRKSFWKE